MNKNTQKCKYSNEEKPIKKINTFHFNFVCSFFRQLRFWFGCDMHLLLFGSTFFFKQRSFLYDNNQYGENNWKTFSFIEWFKPQPIPMKNLSFIQFMQLYAIFLEEKLFFFVKKKLIIYNWLAPATYTSSIRISMPVK